MAAKEKNIARASSGLRVTSCKWGAHGARRNAPRQEWGLSTTDQRHRVVAACTAEPQPFHHDHATLRWMFNDWRLATVVTIGSGRPVNARIVGDANGDGNAYNDRLPGYRRNSFTSPDYATTDLRITRRFMVHDR